MGRNNSIKLNGCTFLPVAGGGEPELLLSHIKQRLKLVKLVLLFLAVWLGSETDVHAQLLKEKILIGRIEWVDLPEIKVKHKARIDTGAKTTSMHAKNIEEVMRGGELFVKFITEDDEGKPIEVTRKVDTTQKVANAGGSVMKRYVIKEKVKMGNIEREVSVNLNDRSKMDYKFLVGRNLLLGRFIVDVARSHVLGD